MTNSQHRHKALQAVMKRECRRLVARPLYLFCMVAAPLFCCVFFTTLMDSGLPVNLPAGVVDRDMSSTSRQLCFDSRTPSSIARSFFCPRSFTPMTTSAHSRSSSARSPE